jgi:hypothetical protein
MIALEFFLIFVLEILGILFHVSQKVIQLDKANPEKKIPEIYSLFFDNEWASLIVSLLVLVTNIVAHIITVVYFPGYSDVSVTVPYIDLTVPAVVGFYLLALVCGYAGQRIAYNYLGKAETYLNTKVS